MNAHNFIHIEINLARIKTEKNFLSVIATEFRFPSYFGGNGDAMNDCMRDLSWFSESYINIVFLGVDKIKDEAVRREVITYLQFWTQYWSNAESYQWYWDLHSYGKTVIINF